MSLYIAEQFDVNPIAMRVLLLAREVKSYEKIVKFYPEIFEFKLFVRSNNWNNGFDLATQYIWFFFLLLISKYEQKTKWADT